MAILAAVFRHFKGVSSSTKLFAPNYILIRPHERMKLLTFLLSWEIDKCPLNFPKNIFNIFPTVTIVPNAHNK